MPSDPKSTQKVDTEKLLTVILEHLAAGAPPSLAQLAAIFDTHPQTLKYHLDKLIDRGDLGRDEHGKLTADPGNRFAGEVYRRFTPQEKHMIRAEILDYLKTYEHQHGQPAPKTTAAHDLGLGRSVVEKHLEALHAGGYIDQYNHVIDPDRALGSFPATVHRAALNADRPLVIAPPPAESDPEAMTLIQDWDVYTPPADRAALERDAHHFRAAARAHLATIERQHRKIRKLERLVAALEGHTLDVSLAEKHFKDQQIAALHAENTRLKNELEHATDAWRTYERETRAHQQLFAYARFSVGRIANLEAQIRQLAGDLEWFQDNADSEVLFWKAKAKLWEHLARQSGPHAPLILLSRVEAFTPSEYFKGGLAA